VAGRGHPRASSRDDRGPLFGRWRKLVLHGFCDLRRFIVFKLYVRRFRVSLFALLGALVLALALLFGLSHRGKVLAAAPAAPVNIFDCTPQTVAAFSDRVHVSCSPADGSIVYFAYCSTKDSATANRFLSVFTTAKALGKGINIYFDPTDTSGTSCGCQAGNCRVIQGAEVRP
jgi:hypothetical protein